MSLPSSDPLLAARSAFDNWRASNSKHSRLSLSLLLSFALILLAFVATSTLLLLPSLKLHSLLKTLSRSRTLILISLIPLHKASMPIRIASFILMLPTCAWSSNAQTVAVSLYLFLLPTGLISIRCVLPSFDTDDSDCSSFEDTSCCQPC